MSIVRTSYRDAVLAPPGRRCVYAGCITAACVPAFELHGNLAWANPFAGNVTLAGKNITNYGIFSFHSFNGTLVVKGSAKLERFGESAFSNAGGGPGVIPSLVFDGDFPFLTSIGDNAFKEIGRALGSSPNLKSGLTFNARNAFALWYIGKETFGGFYDGYASFQVSSQRSEPLEVLSEAFFGTYLRIQFHIIRLRRFQAHTWSFPKLQR